MTQQPTITTVEQLYEFRPDTCGPAREWLDENNITDLADAWDRCHRADWMLWLCNALDLLRDRELRMIACKCVRETPLADGRRVWDLLTDERNRQAVEVAERHARGDATDEQLADAWNAARVAAKEADAAHAEDAPDEAWASYAAGAAAAYAAASAAADAAHAAAAADAADTTYVLDAAHAAQADIIREIVGNPWRGKETSDQ